MSLNISQLLACTTLTHWFPVTARSQQSTADIIMILLAGDKQMTIDDLTLAGKGMKIGCHSHVGTTVSQMYKQNKIYRVDMRRPFKYAIYNKEDWVTSEAP